jgi:hypothetical protein
MKTITGGFWGLVIGATAVFGQPSTAPVVDRARIFPAPGQEAKLAGARVSASNGGETVGFVELGRIAAPPAAGQWAELRFGNKTPYRWVKFEGPDDSHGVVAEVEFFAGEKQLTGKPFGVAGERVKGHDFSKALDGDTATWFDAFLASGAYVGLDLGTAENITPPPVLDLPPGHYAQPVTVNLRAPAGTTRRCTTDGTLPSAQSPACTAPLKLERGMTAVSAIAFAPGKFASETVSGIYTVGDVPPPKGLATFSTGNSLSDTFNNGWLEPVCRSAGYAHKGYRFSVPGAPTEWLWTRPGQGFGKPDYTKAFVELAPLDILITQPFHGHGRSIENEAFYSGNFYRLARESSPNIQLWLYQQWPGRDFQDRWAQLKGPDLEPLAKARGLTPAANWEQAVTNHLAYFEGLREKMQRDCPGRPVRIAPVGLALVNLKRAQEAGAIPGLAKDLFFELHYNANTKGPGWDIHMQKRGAYFVTLVLFSCFYQEPPTKVNVPTAQTTLTPEQDQIYKQLVWDTVRNYLWAGVTPQPAR